MSGIAEKILFLTTANFYYLLSLNKFANVIET